MSHPRYNREILASITFEPHPKKKAAPLAAPTQPSLNPQTAVGASATAVTAPPIFSSTQSNEATARSIPNNSSVAAPPPDHENETQLVIACMKLALSKSISNISLPDKNRPLDPRKDFTIASSLQFKKAKHEGAHLRNRGSPVLRPPRASMSCCSAAAVKDQRPPPLASSARGQPSAMIPSSEGGGAEGPEAQSHEPLNTLPDRSGVQHVDAAQEDDVSDDDSDGCGAANGHHSACRAPASFVFTDYSPMAYRHIRGFFSVDPHSYRQVLVQSTWHSVPTPGKSSAQLFFCGRNWVIKTMNTEESDFLRNVLHKYYYHARDNPFTLLPHFVGHHMIELNGKKITFVIMQNVFATANKIHEKYDLKGSTIGRFATKVEKMKQTCTQKDLDINRPILIGETRRGLLTDQMKKDCDFLRRSSIMDYSLLIGIHVVPRSSNSGAADGGEQGVTEADGGGDAAASTTHPSAAATVLPPPVQPDIDGTCFTADQGGILSLDEVNGRREIYYIGIIDILQEYNLWKRSETVVMGIRRRSLHQISSVPPDEYASRFLSFMSSLLV